MHRALAIGLFLALSVPGSATAAALSLSAGSFDVKHQAGDEWEIGLEARPVETGLGFLPEPAHLTVITGAMATDAGTAYAYGGFRYELEVGQAKRWVIGVSSAAGLYDAGSETKELGGPVEFRSAIEVARRLRGGSSLGLALYHLSNAGIYDDNPGTESLILTYTFGVGGNR